MPPAFGFSKRKFQGALVSTLILGLVFWVLLRAEEEEDDEDLAEVVSSRRPSLLLDCSGSSLRALSMLADLLLVSPTPQSTSPLWSPNGSLSSMLYNQFPLPPPRRTPRRPVLQPVPLLPQPCLSGWLTHGTLGDSSCSFMSPPKVDFVWTWFVPFSSVLPLRPAADLFSISR